MRDATASSLLRARRLPLPALASLRWFLAFFSFLFLSFPALLAGLSGCLPEGPPFRGQLLVAHDGLTQVLPAHGLVDPKANTWLLPAHLDDAADDDSVLPSLYRLEGSGAPVRVAHQALWGIDPWSQDGGFWFLSPDDSVHSLSLSSPSNWEGDLDKLEPDGQLSTGLAHETNVRVANLFQLGDVTFISAGYAATDTKAWLRGQPIPAGRDLKRVGPWFLTILPDMPGALVRFREDALTPELLIDHVSSWNVLPLATRPNGFIVVGTDHGETLFVDPDTREVMPSPLSVPLRNGAFLVSDDGLALAIFHDRKSADVDAKVSFVDPQTWSEEVQVLPGIMALDTWRAAWRPGRHELWVNSGSPYVLFALTPGQPARVFPGLLISSAVGEATQLGAPFLNSQASLSSFAFHVSPFTKDAQELLVQVVQAEKDDAAGWLPSDATSADSLRPVAGDKPQLLGVIPGEDGEAWSVARVFSEPRLFFSARPATPDVPAVVVERARDVGPAWFGQHRALAIINTLGEPPRGDLVLMDTNGTDTWLASNVMSFFPVAACADCDALATGAHVAYVVNATRPWERNGLWTCTLP